MDYRNFFIELIDGFLNNKYERKYIAHKMSSEIDIDEIKGDHNDLLVNCEWALRHINEESYYTTETELKYYLSCLKGEKQFNEKERDELILRL